MALPSYSTVAFPSYRLWGIGVFAGAPVVETLHGLVTFSGLRQTTNLKVDVFGDLIHDSGVRCFVMYSVLATELPDSRHWPEVILDRSLHYAAQFHFREETYWRAATTLCQQQAATTPSMPVERAVTSGMVVILTAASFEGGITVPPAGHKISSRWEAIFPLSFCSGHTHLPCPPRPGAAARQSIPISEPMP